MIVIVDLTAERFACNLISYGRWCRREWSSPADTRNADASRRLYSSVFLGSPELLEYSENLHTNIKTITTTATTTTTTTTTK
ncbi:hypothetical protein GQX74_006414 [Glossina fuscipes]|nr:hypothetical protein GQX74_006414 [Glossina fuscipes]